MRIPVFPQILYMMGCGIFLAKHLHSGLSGVAIWIPAISRNKKGLHCRPFLFDNHLFNQLTMLLVSNSCFRL